MHCSCVLVEVHGGGGGVLHGVPGLHHLGDQHPHHPSDNHHGELEYLFLNLTSYLNFQSLVATISTKLASLTRLVA